jgi:septum formation protein
VPAEVDETPLPGETAEPYVERLALDKARAVAAAHPGRLVLGADTTVTVDGAILGKAGGEADARQMLERLAGRVHEVHTGVALALDEDSTVACATTRVWFAPMTSEDIQRYISTGEWHDKAGAYGIQGWISRFVARVEGSYTNVVGLPVALVWDLLMRYPVGRGTHRSQP